MTDFTARTAHAAHMSKGQKFFGRRDWILTVEEVKTCGDKIELACLNEFGEPVTERYMRSHILTILA